MKIFNFLFMAVMTLLPMTMNAQRIQQKLGRGVVAVKRSGTSRTADGGSGALISWRTLAQENAGTTYHPHQRKAGSENYTKVNSTPLTKTNYSPSTLISNTVFAVSAVINRVDG